MTTCCGNSKNCGRPVCFAALAATVVVEVLDQRAHFTPGNGSLTGVTNTLAVHVLEINRLSSFYMLSGKGCKIEIMTVNIMNHNKVRSSLSSLLSADGCDKSAQFAYDCGVRGVTEVVAMYLP